MKSHRIEVEPFNLACRYHCSPEVDVSNVAEGDEWGKWSEFLRFQGFAGHPVQQLLVFRNQAHIVVDESVGEGAGVGNECHDDDNAGGLERLLHGIPGFY